MELIKREDIDRVFYYRDSSDAIGIYEDILDLPTVKAYTKEEVLDIVTNILLDISKVNNPYKADHNDLLTLSKHNGFVDAKAIILDMLEEKIDELRGVQIDGK